MGEKDAIEQASGIIEVDDESSVTSPGHGATEEVVADGGVSENHAVMDAVDEGVVAVDDDPTAVAMSTSVTDATTTTDVSGEAAADDALPDVPDADVQRAAIDRPELPADGFEAVDVVAETVAADVVAEASAADEHDVAEAAGSDEAHQAAAVDATVEEGAAVEPETDTFEPPARASAELKAILEALIFASPEPLSLKALTKLLDSEPKEDVATALAGLKEDYERPGGLQLVEVAGGYQIVTRHDLHEWVRRLFHERSTQKLSAQALETLAVIAYRQPITAVEITEIRGVNTSGVLNTLLERHLIKIVGRKAVVGRPFMYSSTKEFLIRFGLNDLTDLPRVEDMVDALGLEAPLLVEQAPLEDQLPLEEPDAESDEVPSSGDDAELGEPDEPEDPETRGGPEGSVH